MRKGVENMQKKRVLCYGDSLTWGFEPLSGARFDSNMRWTGVCQEILGEDYIILEEGLSGRTTIYEDPCKPCRNGRKGLSYCLLSQSPLDLVVLFLGTNDLKFTDVYGAANGIDELTRIVMGADTIFSVKHQIFPNGPKVLLVSPPHIDPDIKNCIPESSLASNSTESFRFAETYELVAQKWGAGFLDASKIVKPSCLDFVHIDAGEQKKLGKEIATAIKEIFSE